MKKYLITLMILASITFGYSQDRPDKLFKKSKNVGGFGGVNLLIVNSKNLAFAGEGAAIINNFYVGGFGYEAQSGSYYSDSDGRNYRLSESIGGIMLGVISNPTRKLAIYFETKVGFGEAKARTALQPNIYKEFTRSVIGLMPAIGITLLPTGFVKLKVYGGYKYMGDVELNNLKGDTFNGAIFGMALNFGKF